MLIFSSCVSNVYGTVVIKFACPSCGHETTILICKDFPPSKIFTDQCPRCFEVIYKYQEVLLDHDKKIDYFLKENGINTGEPF